MDLRDLRFWIAILLVAGGVGFVVTKSSGCSEAVEAVDNVAEQVTGNQAVKQGAAIREQLRQLVEERDSQLPTEFR